MRDFAIARRFPYDIYRFSVVCLFCFRGARPFMVFVGFYVVEVVSTMTAQAPGINNSEDKLRRSRETLLCVFIL